MKPLELGRARAQVTRKRPTPQDHLRLRQQAVALLAAADTFGPRSQVTRRGEGRPALPNLAVKAAAGVGQADASIDGLDPPPFLGADPLDAQHIKVTH